MISSTINAIVIWCISIASCNNQLTYEEVNDPLEIDFLKLNDQIMDVQAVIMRTLAQTNETYAILQELEEGKHWILSEMCVMEILSNSTAKAVLIFNSIGNELSIKTIVGELYIVGDLTMFEQIVEFINNLEIKYTKINGLTELYEILIDNDDFNIVNGIMLLDSVLLNGKDGTHYINNVLVKRLSQVIEKKDFDPFFKYARNYERQPFVFDMIPTLVSLIYANNSENIQLVLDLLQQFYYVDQKIHAIFALSKEISDHGHENSALAVLYYIIHFEAILTNNQQKGNHRPLLEKIKTILPDNFIPLLYTDICIMNKYYGLYLYVDSDDHVWDNLYRPILTRKTINPSLMYICSMKFGIQFQCREANCYILIENLMNADGEFMFAENDTVHMYKGNVPDGKQMQSHWRLESDGEFFQLKNEKSGTYLYMDEITEGNGYGVSLKDIMLNWNSDKTKWKIEKCEQHLSYDDFQQY